MEDIFFHFWWLIFPLAFFIAGGFSSFMRYQRTKAKIDLLKTYAAAGKEPPAELLRNLDRDDENSWHEEGTGRKKEHGSAFLVILFVGLAAVFAFEGTYELLGLGEVAYFIAMIMAVLSLAFLAGAIFKRRD